MEEESDQEWYWIYLFLLFNKWALLKFKLTSNLSNDKI